jgi:hypothetical protein
MKITPMTSNARIKENYLDIVIINIDPRIGQIEK